MCSAAVQPACQRVDISPSFLIFYKSVMYEPLCRLHRVKRSLMMSGVVRLRSGLTMSDLPAREQRFLFAMGTQSLIAGPSLVFNKVRVVSFWNISFRM